MLARDNIATDLNILFATRGILFCIIVILLGMVSNSVFSEEQDNQETLDDEEDYLISESELGLHKVRLVQGNKKNSTWLVVDNQFIMHRNDHSVDSSQYYWECSHRRKAVDCR